MFRRPSPRPSIHLPIHLPIHLSPIHRSRYSRRPLLRSTCSRPPSRSHACRSSVAMRVATAPQVSHGPPPAHTHACTARTPHTSRPLGWTSGHRGGSTALATVLRAHELWFRLLAKSQPYRTVGLSLCLSRPPHPALIIHKFSQKKKKIQRDGRRTQKSPQQAKWRRDECEDECGTAT